MQTENAGIQDAEFTPAEADNFQDWPVPNASDSPVNTDGKTESASRTMERKQLLHGVLRQQENFFRSPEHTDDVEPEVDAAEMHAIFAYSLLATKSSSPILFSSIGHQDHKTEQGQEVNSGKGHFQIGHCNTTGNRDGSIGHRSMQVSTAAFCFTFPLLLQRTLT